MGMLDLLKPRYQLVLGDCATRNVSRSEHFPAHLSGASGEGRKIPLCRISRERGEFLLETLDSRNPVLLNGRPVELDEVLVPGRPYGLSLRGHLIVVCIARGRTELEASFQDGRWDIASVVLPHDRETLPREAFSRAALSERYPDPREMLAFPLTGDACFTLSDLIAAIDEPTTPTEPEAPKKEPASPSAPAPIQFFAAESRQTKSAVAVKGEARRACPCCWKRFSPGEALSIAAHDALMGDPILGPHTKLRFPAERFNSLGQALDAHGVISTDLACPHCRGRLPPSFFSQEQLILSLIGAPSSGKSYYLSVLLRLLPLECIRHFGANLQDGDPSGNAQLNEMKNRLFSATTPEDAFISKTDFEGVMYDRLYRDGKLVALPRPFVYYLQQFEEPRRRASLVFYDNAGEHFQPGIPLDDSPGALHVAASAGLLFLFDPSTNRSFRQSLSRKRFPQLRMPSTDEQDTILSELGVRIKKMRALEAHDRVYTPLAVVVGKFDLWHSLLEPDSIAMPEDRPLTEEEIVSNSRAVRRLLAELCPTIVANAESISHHVMYFPASPLGHSPREIHEGPLAGRLAPVPSRLKPILATAPALWLIRQAAPDLLAPAPANTPARERVAGHASAPLVP